MILSQEIQTISERLETTVGRTVTIVADSEQTARNIGIKAKTETFQSLEVQDHLKLLQKTGIKQLRIIKELFVVMSATESA